VVSAGGRAASALDPVEDETFDVVDREFFVVCHEVDEAVSASPVLIVVFLCGVECEGDAFAVGEVLELVFGEFVE